MIKLGLAVEPDRVFRCMMFFDLCYLITGISLITVGLTNNPENKVL